MKAKHGGRAFDLHALRVFLAVIEAGSMTGAATRQGLTQSAVSQIIRQLEECMGTVLVDRSQRPVALTITGRVLQRHAQAIIHDAEALEAAVRHASSAKVQELRIGVVDSFASTVGPTLIKTLLKTTATHISFRSGLAHDQAEGLLSRNLDFIITSDPLDDVDGLERYVILSEPFLLLLPDKLGLVPELHDLKRLAAAHSMIRFSARSQIGTQIERCLRLLGIKAARLLEVDATDTLTAMVSAGLGWAIATPLCLLQVGSRIKDVRALPFPVTGFSRQLHLITRAEEYADLSRRIVDLSCEILRRECIPEARRLVPWLKNQIVVG
ncbi:MAG: LysR family transcriptional regulator [Burkholderiales bacterium]|nr:LysR family transcriptional regulator [Burkholderiales bacterium]